MQQSRMPAVSRVQEVFEQVLSHPDFSAPAESPLRRAIAWVLEALSRFFARWLPDAGEAQVRLLSWALLVGAAGVGVYLLWRWASERGPASQRRSSPRGTTPTPRDAAAWATWARGEALEGRLREAATGLYEAVLLHLEAEGALRYGEWKTPGDYALEASEDPALRGPFRSFLGQFVAVAFGSVEPTPEALDSLFARAERLGCPI